MTLNGLLGFKRHLLEPNPNQNSTVYGLFNAAIGLTALPASLIAGLLWQGIGGWSGFGAAAPFVFGAGMAILAGVLLMAWVKE